MSSLYIGHGTYTSQQLDPYYLSSAHVSDIFTVGVRSRNLSTNYLAYANDSAWVTYNEHRKGTAAVVLTM